MDLLVVLGGGAGALVMLGTLARGLWRINRRIVLIADTVRELTPNGGRSIKDTVTRTEQKVDDTAVKVDETAAKVHATAHEVAELTRRLDEHLADGPSQQG